MVNWTGYLESLCNDDKYVRWWNAYTLTDVIGQQRSPLLLDFMVETVKPAKGEPSQAQEKTERLDVLEGLRKYAKEHVLLVGRPGSGKSTALARLLLEEAENSKKAEERNVKIPVLVELRYYQTSILDLIRDFCKRHRLLLDIATIEQLLLVGDLLLLVDGINELPSEAARQDLYKFRQDYQKTTPMIFTTRDLGVGGDLGITKKLEMQALTAEQMQQFVRAYLPEQGEQMLQQSEQAIPELIKLLEDKDSSVRDSAASALGKIKSEQAIPGLIKLLEDKDYFVRDSAASALGEIKSEQAIPGLIKWLEDEDYFVRDSAVSALGKIKSEQAIPGLIKLLEHQNSNVRRSAASALGEIKSEQAIPGLIKLLEDKDSYVRDSAASALGQIKSEQAIPGLIKLLEDENFWVRISAASALGEIKSEQAIPGLIKLLEDQESWVSRSAASALGKIKSEAAIPPLMNLLNNEKLVAANNGDTLRYALQALEAITGKL
jgi:HEAT repeat protein